MARFPDLAGQAATKQAAECGKLNTKSYNQVDQLTNEISALREVIIDQKEELLNLYRRMYTGQDRPNY